jgi:hypothetical protein
MVHLYKEPRLGTWGIEHTIAPGKAEDNVGRCICRH